MPTNTVRVVARFTAKADKIDALKTLALSLLEPTRRESGCLRYEPLQNAADSSDLTFVEEWASDAALDAHLKMPHVAGALSKLGDILASPPDIRRYRTLG